MKNKVSAVILTRNNGDKIKEFYSILKDLDETVVVDDNSTDHTKLLCEKYGIRYFNHSLSGDFSAQRNFALDQVKNDWVLFIDSDEKIDNLFIKIMKTEINKNVYNGFFIKRINNFIKHQMVGTEMGNQNIIRLARKSKGRWERKVHEYWNVRGDVGYLHSPIYHETAKTTSDFINKIGSYYLIHAQENIASGKKPYLYKIIIFPLLKYYKNILLLKGYRDSTYGYVFSVFMSFHSFLSWSSAWLKQRSI